MSNQKTFQLSSEEAKYILTLISEDSSLRKILPTGSELGIGQKVLTLGRDEAELLRDYFTDRLPRVGFDEKYEPNPEGVMLEGLTDKLFLTDEEWSAG